MSFGWAYVGCDDIAISSMAGPSGSILCRTSAFTVSGSDNYKLFDEGNQNHTVLLTGSLKVKGSANMTGDLTIGGNLVANSYSVVSTTITEIAANGSTNLGNGFDDVHRITGTLDIKGPTGAEPVLSVTGAASKTGNAVGVLTNAPTSHFSVSGSVAFGYLNIAGTSQDLRIGGGPNAVFVGCSNNAAVSLTLPNPANIPGRILVIKDEASTQPRTGATKITLTASAGTIDGQSHYFILGSRAAISLYSNGASGWFVF